MQSLLRSNASFNVYHELQDIIAILGMDELSDEEKTLVVVLAGSNSSCHKTSTLRNNLQVNLVLMYQLEKLFVALKKFWMGNMTIFLKMPSVVLGQSKM